MDASLKQDLQGPSPLVFGAVEILLPTSTIRLATGAPIVIEGNTFSPRSAVYGTLSEVDGVEDGLDDVVPQPTVTLAGITDAGIVSLSAPAAQGSAIRLWFGTIDRASGLATGVQQVFTGILDTCELSIAQQVKEFSLYPITELARALEPKDFRRCSDSFHQSIWPGERGMRRRPDLRRAFYWRLSGQNNGYPYSNDGAGTSAPGRGLDSRINL